MSKTCLPMIPSDGLQHPRHAQAQGYQGRSPWLVRLLPLQVSATHNRTKKLNVNVMMVPRGTFLTEAQARAVQAGAPLDLDTLCIDVSPTPTVNDAPPMERATADEAAE